MSRAHNGHGSFFPVGNPFRVIFPGRAHLSRKLQELLTSYEDALALSLRKLKPDAASDVATLSWMRLAVDCLSELYTNIGTLITELELPVSDWDEKWVDVYLNSSVKLLDICIALSSDLSRLDKGQLLVQYVLHLLDSESGMLSQEQLKRAEPSLKEWMELVGVRCPRLVSCSTTLQELAESLCLMKVKNSAKGKVLMRALYGIEAVTVFICSIFVAVLSSSPKPLVELHVPENFGWSQAFNDLHAIISGELSRQLYSGRVAAVKELEEVEACAKRLYELASTSQLEETTNLANAVNHTKEIVMSDSIAQEGETQCNLEHAYDTSKECEVVMLANIAEEGTQGAEMEKDTKIINHEREVKMLERIICKEHQDSNIKQVNGNNDDGALVLFERTSVQESREELLNCISKMSKSAEGLRLGLDSLSKRVRDFFQLVLTGRDALLCNLRISDATSKVAVVRS
ncbi:hypothetical protein GUJ93_ZPchr0012g19029 [Zizania palustris]|uniref:Uncharacterized protein n=1 Tax=Zizania palustris TaxID=103762 RepID=A0A8J6BTA3_ZIZPA|nr:hypothetical protein GUJ93_ZPchr0012g19029 [Zizania palustris]KAG8092261.1 hypothetical protein GUJ93_ZPchr0012g19029 [Zizania palustris]